MSRDSIRSAQFASACNHIDRLPAEVANYISVHSYAGGISADLDYPDLMQDSVTFTLTDDTHIIRAAVQNFAARYWLMVADGIEPYHSRYDDDDDYGPLDSDPYDRDRDEYEPGGKFFEL